MTTTLSARQYPLLKLFMKHASEAGWFMKMPEAATLDQRPFRSLLMRGWIRYERGYGFQVTYEGKDAWHNFLHTSIERSNPHGPLCAFFYATNKVERPETKRGAMEIVRRKSA